MPAQTDTQNHFALLRFNSDGLPDTNFGTGALTGGLTTAFCDLGFSTETATGLMVDATGRLIMVGTATHGAFSSFAIASYDPSKAPQPAPPGSVPVAYDPPVLRMLTPDQVIQQNGTATVSAMFSDTVDSGDYTYSIDWGDGSTVGPITILAPSIVYGSGAAMTVGLFSTSHPYTSPGVYYVTATVADPNPNHETDTQTIQVTVDSSLTFQTTSVPNATVVTGQTYTLPPVYFTGFGTHTATINWGDGETDNATITEPSFDSTGGVPVAGSITGSHTYYTTNTGYPVSITLTDDSQQSVGGSSFVVTNVTVNSPTVALTDFSTDGRSLQVSYAVGGGTTAPFQIDVYTSQDGTTPDQLLGTYTTSGGELSQGNQTVSIAPPAADLSGNYQLIAMIDGDTTDNPIPFDGGVFQGNDGTMYVFGTYSAGTTWSACHPPRLC